MTMRYFIYFYTKIITDYNGSDNGYNRQYYDNKLFKSNQFPSIAELEKDANLWGRSLYYWYYGNIGRGL